MVKGLLPRQLGNRLIIVGSTNERLTRQADNIMIQFRRTRSAQKSIFYEGIKMYNDILAEVKQCDRLVAFKRMLKEFVMSKIV